MINRPPAKRKLRRHPGQMVLPLGRSSTKDFKGQSGEVGLPRKPAATRVAEIPVPPSIDVASLERYFRRTVGRPIQLTINRNRRQLMSFKDERGGWRHVRMSDIFLNADPTVWREIALWMRDTRRFRLFQPGSASREFLDRPDIQETLHERRRMRPDPPHRGVHYDLRKLFDELNRRYFRGRCNCRIGWKRLASRRGTRSVQLGSFHADDNLILVHPVLDTKLIPRFVIEDTVFHEMVHWVLRDRCDENGRREMHSREFYARMEQYPKHIEAEVWVAENIRAIIRWKNQLIRERKAAQRSR